MSKGTFIALAGTLGLALLAGPSAAQNQEAIKLRVPVQLKNMLATEVSVDCFIDHGNLVVGQKKSEPHPIVNGVFDQVIELVVTPSPGKTFAGADAYSCHLWVNKQAPRKGTPASNNDPARYTLAKPDEFFRIVSHGPLDGGGKVVDGIVGPKDLTIGPKPKQ